MSVSDHHPDSLHRATTVHLPGALVFRPLDASATSGSLTTGALSRMVSGQLTEARGRSGLKRRGEDVDVSAVLHRRTRRLLALSTIATVTILSSLLPFASASAATATRSYTFKRTSSPPGTEVRDSRRVVIAVYTDGARTVRVRGQQRTFSEPSTTTASVTTTWWMRVLPAPFDGNVDVAWLESALADSSLDLLAMAMQYTPDAPNVNDGNGQQIAGDAHYGPLLADGSRQEGSDFNDYLGLAWTYGTTVDQPEPEQLASLDCSGFVRMVAGYRLGIPLSLGRSEATLPRRAAQMEAAAPGVVLIPNRGTQATSFERLSPGDLVFFDASTDDGTTIDHVGIYLGPDSGGRHRFVSSRKRADGPTFGDVGGASLLDGSGLYARSFRSARRL